MGGTGNIGSLGCGEVGAAGSERKKCLKAQDGILELITIVNDYLRQCQRRVASLNITSFYAWKIQEDAYFSPQTTTFCIFSFCILLRHILLETVS